MTWKRLFALFLCLSLVMAFSSPSFAKKKKKKSPDSILHDDRILKGHNYLRPYRFPMAMPTTNIGVGLGYAYFQFQWDEKLDVVLFEEDKFSQGGLNESIDVEIEFLNRFSIEGIFEGRAFAGADENSALLYGGQGLYFLSLIPKAMLYQNDNWGTCISLSSALNWDQGVQSSPVVLMVKLLDNFVDLAEELEKDPSKLNDLDEGDLRDLADIDLQDGIITQSTFAIQPALIVAQTLHPVLGLQLSARYSYGIQETVDAPELFDLEAGDPPMAWQVGAVTTFDLNPISRAHLGFKLEADYESESDDGYDTTTIIVGGGVMYTGRKDLELGATFYRDSEDEEDLSAVGYFMILNMRYFF